MKDVFKSKKFLIALVSVMILAIITGIVCVKSKNKSTLENNPKTAEEYIEKEKEELKEQAKEEILNKNNVSDTDSLNKENAEVKSDNVKVEKNSKYSKEYKEYMKKTDAEKKELDVIPRQREVKYEELNTIIADQEKDLNIDETSKKEENTENNTEKDKDKNENITVEPTPTIPDEPIGEKLPKKFNLADKIDLKVKDQGTLGLCWDFASMTSLETNLKLTKNKTYDFSESAVDYLASEELGAQGRKANDGGNFNMFLTCNNTYKGFILEEDIPYGSYDDIEYKTFGKMDKENILITKTVDFPSINKNELKDEEYQRYMDSIKVHIQNYGSLYASIASSWDEYCYNPDYEWCDHAISLVGWDDNFPKEKFKKEDGRMPKENGAFIALNSWGDYWGDNGYFYISYDDATVYSTISGVISTDEEYLIKLSDELSSVLDRGVHEEIIELEDGKYITQSLCDSITSLNLKGINLKDYNELKIFKNLAYFNLSETDIDNLEFLKDIEYISDLNISNTKIKNIDMLKKFEYLWELNISGLRLEKPEILKELKCICLIADDIDLKKLDDICNSELMLLSIKNNKNIESFNVPQNMISEFYCSNCNIEDLSFIKQFVNVMTLDISNNNIQNLEKLKDLDIYNLIYNDNETVDIDAFSKLGGFGYLELKNDNLKDITKLRNLNITELVLDGNEEVYGDLSGAGIAYLSIKDCKKTKEFDFFNCLDDIYRVDVAGNDISYEKINDVAVMYEKDIYVRTDKIDDDFCYDNINVVLVNDKEDIIKVNVENNENIFVDLKNISLEFQEGYIINIDIDDSDKIISSNLLQFEIEKPLNTKLYVEYNDFNWERRDCIIEFESNNSMIDENEIITLKQPDKYNLELEDFVDLTGGMFYKKTDEGIYQEIKTLNYNKNQKAEFGWNQIEINGIMTQIPVKSNKLYVEDDNFFINLCNQFYESEMFKIDLDKHILEVNDYGFRLLNLYGFMLNEEDIKYIDCIKNLRIHELEVNVENNKITYEDLEKLKLFPRLRTIYVFNNGSLSDEEVTVESDYFEIYVYSESEWD